jgi:hypothetical protein
MAARVQLEEMRRRALPGGPGGPGQDSAPGGPPGAPPPFTNPSTSGPYL